MQEARLVRNMNAKADLKEAAQDPDTSLMLDDFAEVDGDETAARRST
ncbi:MAG: hypothetical protein RLZZ450_5395 [Pseudomonadota bacterium]|jgi:hypothetical protein